MKCCSIKLADRTEVQQFLLKRKEVPCHSMILGHGDNNCSRFEFSNYKSNYQKDDPPQLTVLNISLPRDVKAFNTGASLQRWTNKRPRLKSARNSAKSEINLENSNTYTFDVSILIEEFCNEYHPEASSEDVVSANDSVEQIHPDIRQLLEVTHEETEETTEKENCKIIKRNAKLRHKKKKKKALEVLEIIEPKKKVTKTVSFSLSKPPTPQTEQIIRVDIVSNYSVDIEVSENCNKGKNVKQQEQSAKLVEKDAFIELLSESNKREAKNLVVESKKVVLYQRDMDSNKNV